jgi:AraC-like DNA-binding protein
VDSRARAGLPVARVPRHQRTQKFETLAGGLHASPALIVHQGRQSGIQIALSPLGARALLRVPAAEIAHIDVDADRLLGPAALEMSERAREANTWQDRFTVVDEVLGRRLHAEAAPRIEVASAWRHIVSSNGSISVDRLVRMVGWSSRLLSQRFHAEFGLTPKAAARWCGPIGPAGSCSAGRRRGSRPLCRTSHGPVTWSEA